MRVCACWHCKVHCVFVCMRARVRAWKLHTTALTDAERQAEDAELVRLGLKKDPNAKKSKLKFMQK